MTQNKVKIAVKVGLCLGSSTRHTASLLQQNSKLYVLDTWEGSIEYHQNQEWEVMFPNNFWFLKREAFGYYCKFFLNTDLNI